VVSLASALRFGLASISQVRNPALLLQHVTVIDATGAELQAVDVLIRGNRIEKIASYVSPPRGSRVVPADGKFLIPGLWDMHVRVWEADLAFPLFLANGVTGVRNMGGHPEGLNAGAKSCTTACGSGPA
jgi:cytosine/adenosine deaminase-related metal-dependent hydrolase